MATIQLEPILQISIVLGVTFGEALWQNIAKGTRKVYIFAILQLINNTLGDN